MSETNKTLRIHTSINNPESASLMVQLDQNYNTFEILSLKLREEDVYKLHSANYGVVVGRVLANGNFGVPNAKISVFIEGNFENEEISTLYPYKSTTSKNEDGVRYNLLPNEKVSDCHQNVGTFPIKTYLLDNDVLVEVFDKYYKYTTRTNNSGDYIICGVPVGNQTIHMDLDLSDCGILSQRPRDFVYKGYNIEQFENPNQFKKSENLSSLSQIFTQDQVVNVIPFWGDESNGETIGITRADIDINFKFEPTCVFLGSVVADNSSNGISKKCVPTPNMGSMEELTTGEGTIEMIRYTPGGNIEEFQIKGSELIDGNGVWCYQIPMNLDYIMTDEYGNIVPTDDPNKGIPTRTRVRFRVSLHDDDANIDNFFRAKVLVPHNPSIESNGYDYEFGSNTQEDSFRDLLWNNVYTVKSYIPRFQKGRGVLETNRFSGIKGCNHNGNNNPMPYNNIRIRVPLMYTMLCSIIKSFIRIVYIVNSVLSFVYSALKSFVGGLNTINDTFLNVLKYFPGNILLNLVGLLVELLKNSGNSVIYKFRFLTISGDLCPDLENWYFAPTRKDSNIITEELLKQTLGHLVESDDLEGNTDNDPPILDKENGRPIADSNSKSTYTDTNKQNYCLTIYVDYFVSCIEMALAQEYNVINFDFYNDWVNGVIYIPRWMRLVKRKKIYNFTNNGLKRTIKTKIKACMDNTEIFNKTRVYVQQCALTYGKDVATNTYTDIKTSNGCVSSTTFRGKLQRCHKYEGRGMYGIFGGSGYGANGNGGVVHENQTSRDQYVYYLKPCEWRRTNSRVLLFANDIVLLGSLLDCNLYGIPQAFRYLSSTSYIMPTNLALTNLDNDGAMYGQSDGTVCSKTYENYEDDTIDTSMTLVEEPNDFAATSKYNKTNDYTLRYGQIKGDSDSVTFDDTIPLTEAAGIAWNYTGPGQGIKSNDVTKSLYMPGGHFLGISCTDSETNIKTCINLQRVCEVGSNISQRREEVYKGDANGVQYRYFVPTGLISNDDISSTDFRTMFATMNHGKLLCDRYDEKTGYPIYGFNFLRPSGFDGALKENVLNDRTSESDDSSPWNKKLDNIVDEGDNTSAFKHNKVDYSVDREETGETYTRTNENTKIDYYKFRLGITDDEFNTRKGHTKHFLIHRDNPTGGVVMLPQYENSYYFYFGLKDGSSALDEFNKQFFSVCDTTDITRSKLTLNIDKYSVDETCHTLSEITLWGDNAEGEVTITYTYTTPCGNEVSEVVDSSHIEIDDFGTYVIDITNLNIPIGPVTFSVMDDNGVAVSKKLSLSFENEISQYTIETKDFEFKVNENDSLLKVSSKAKAKQCGYIKIHFDKQAPEYETELLILERDNRNYYAYSNDTYDLNNIVTGYSTCLVLDNSKRVKADSEWNNIDKSQYVYLWKPNAYYDIYLATECNEQTNLTYLTTVFINGIDDVDLYVGSKLVPFTDEWDKKNLFDKNNWWQTMSADTIDGNSTDHRHYVPWAVRYALTRRTDDDLEGFENKVFALNDNNEYADTTLFGEPELYSGTTENPFYVLPYKSKNVFYEDDIYSGNVSDTSYLPTKFGGETTSTTKYYRNLFGESPIIDNKVMTDKIGSVYNVLGYTEEDNTKTLVITGSTNTITYTGGSENVRDEIINYVKKNEGLIIRLNDGTILNAVVTAVTTNSSSFSITAVCQTEYIIDSNAGKDASLYPVLSYPVMYRPFYAKLKTFDWVNIGYTESVDEFGNVTFVVGYNDVGYNSKLSVYNGLTLSEYNDDYTRYFKECKFITNINEIEISKDRDKFIVNGDDLSGCTGSISARTGVVSDKPRISETTGNVLTNINDTESSNVLSYGFTVTENGPEENTINESDWELLNIPKKIELKTISNNTTNDLQPSLMYGQSNGLVRFRKSTVDDYQYFLVKKSFWGSGSSNIYPLSGDGYVHNEVNSRFLFQYGSITDVRVAASLEETVEDGSNKMGMNVEVTLQKVNGPVANQYQFISFPCFRDSNQTIRNMIDRACKDPQNTSQVIGTVNKTLPEMVTWLKSKFGLTPVYSYKWRDEISIENVLTKLFPSTGSNGLYWDDIENKYIVKGTNIFEIPTFDASFEFTGITGYTGIGIKRVPVNNKGSNEVIRFYPSLIEMKYSSEDEPIFIPYGTLKAAKGNTLYQKKGSGTFDMVFASVDEYVYHAMSNRFGSFTNINWDRMTNKYIPFNTTITLPRSNVQTGRELGSYIGIDVDSNTKWMAELVYDESNTTYAAKAEATSTGKPERVSFVNHTNGNISTSKSITGTGSTTITLYGDASDSGTVVPYETWCVLKFYVYSSTTSSSIISTAETPIYLYREGINDGQYAINFYPTRVANGNMDSHRLFAQTPIFFTYNAGTTEDENIAIIHNNAFSGLCIDSINGVSLNGTKNVVGQYKGITYSASVIPNEFIPLNKLNDENCRIPDKEWIMFKIGGSNNSNEEIIISGTCEGWTPGTDFTDWDDKVQTTFKIIIFPRTKFNEKTPVSLIEETEGTGSRRKTYQVYPYYSEYNNNGHSLSSDLDELEAGTGQDESKFIDGFSYDFSANTFIYGHLNGLPVNANVDYTTLYGGRFLTFYDSTYAFNFDIDLTKGWSDISNKAVNEIITNGLTPLTYDYTIIPEMFHTQWDLSKPYINLRLGYSKACAPQSTYLNPIADNGIVIGPKDSEYVGIVCATTTSFNVMCYAPLEMSYTVNDGSEIRNLGLVNEDKTIRLTASDFDENDNVELNFTIKSSSSNTYDFVTNDNIWLVGSSQIENIFTFERGNDIVKGKKLMGKIASNGSDNMKLIFNKKQYDEYGQDVWRYFYIRQLHVYNSSSEIKKGEDGYYHNGFKYTSPNGDVSYVSVIKSIKVEIEWD